MQFNYNITETDDTFTVSVSGEEPLLHEVKEWVETTLKPVASSSVQDIDDFYAWHTKTRNKMCSYGLILDKKSDLLMFKMRWSDGNHIKTDFDEL